MNPLSYRVPGKGEEWWTNPSEWLTHYMDADPEKGRPKISDAELLRRIQDLGYGGGSRGTVLKWRRGEKMIPPEDFPKICLALGFEPDDVEWMTCEVLREAFPEIKYFIRDPLKERNSRALQTLKFHEELRKLGRSLKKANLERQLSEIEE
ncbi:hypothetical protein [Methylobacterium frigidaeris]|uniref:Uncharacterized protein n=1 Tax=Methylobacterium frigidaeris TaxID=2038277 RepID=A0AA37HJS0_9HYPH|nr:hypothetical protein [Methylobacterium frigidaeris]PIK72111.1 hypothetical protein CS379_15785 [Methylobacterium frigidaeris]GJD67033.1 hypothetical protein MPEAHAMD_7232 [Methylobacterium frigidaeris]